MKTPFVKGKFELRKMDMKGGWTYILLPGQNTKTGLPFGWLVVKGRIDDYEINQYKLWPTADKNLFLPVKAEIRKKIKKQEGDIVEVELFEDQSAIEIPEEFMLCLLDSPEAKHHFENMSATSQKQYIDYVFAAKSMETRARRLTKTIEKLEKGLKYHQKE
jgi:hypothetical protein